MRIQNSNISAIIVIIVCAFIFIGCEKEKYTSRPQLKFKKVNSYNIKQGGIIEFTLEFSDLEGDVTDAVWVKNETTDCKASNFEVAYKLGDFTPSEKLKGEILLRFDNGTQNSGLAIFASGQCTRADTCNVSFWVRDAQGNISDTAKTDKPIILKN